MSKPMYVPRVDQLDAIAWNDELFSLFNAQLKRILLYIPSSSLVRFAPLIETLFRIIFSELPLRYTQSTFGQGLFGLKYCDVTNLTSISKSKLRLLVFLDIIPFLWDNVIRRLLCRNLPSSIDSFEKVFQTLFTFLTLYNFCTFLQQAKYPTVNDRILRIRPIYPSLKGLRNVQYESVNRELLWHGFAEFLSFILPLINIYRIKGYIQRLLKPLYGKRSDVFIDWNCGICGKSPTFPHEFGCQHVFCYYCIASTVIADPNYLCIHCKHEANGLSNIKHVSLVARQTQ